MKTYNSLDIACCVFELQQLIGLRVNQIYDTDNKTYLFKLQQMDNKQVLLIESGTRFHLTSFDWPKNVSPSGFTMKLRKHLKNKRVECIRQLGNDRIVDFQFGSGEAAYHVILELFNRGNIILTDYNLITLNVLRPHTEGGDKFKFTVREAYPISRVRESTSPLNVENLQQIFKNAKSGDKINKILLPHIDYGSALLEHVLTLAGFNKNSKFHGDINIKELEILAEKFKVGEEIFKDIKSKCCKGYIIKTEETRVNQENLVRYLEFHPYLFIQYSNSLYSEFDTFNSAIDEYFSKTEGQKLEMKALLLEREALQKVEKIKENQQQRVENLITSQDVNRRKAELIMANSETVDDIICSVRKAIALQMSWPDIKQYFSDLTREGHYIFETIYAFKLEINHITLALSDPYDDNSEYGNENRKVTPVDVDLSLSAHANATRYYSNKKSAAVKQRKTLESQSKAVKSVERKAKSTLKDLKTMTMITKARKVYWFEKFHWFISSDNYLVIGGRDQQQNEMIVKRYLKKGDIYVHADLNGASSIVIKNPTGNPIPPRTLNEAGNMAVCYSMGWEAKVICSAYWVYHDQVSKAAPAGEYLTTGSFMIRGQKNFLLPAQLSVGFGYLFKLEESSIFRHTEERRPKHGVLEDAGEENVPDSSGRLAGSDTPEIITKNQINETNLGIGDLSTLDLETLSIYDLQKLSADNNDNSDNINEKSEISTINESNEETILSNEGTTCDESKNESSVTQSVSSSAHLSSDDEEITENAEQEGVQSELGDFPDVDLNLSLEMDKNKKSRIRFNMETVNVENYNSESSATSISQSQMKQQSSMATLKRGQRSKIKKIKEKYKDQDEEEKRLRMSILKSDGVKKEPKKSKKSKQHPMLKVKEKNKPDVRIISTNSSSMNRPVVSNEDEVEEDDELITYELDIIDYLTGQPHPEDELLFAIPVVAPYTALVNYKYKVKMVPGSGKRGKCARTAVEYFLKMKDATIQEKSLIKNVNDNILSRDFPGRVKLNFGVQKK